MQFCAVLFAPHAVIRFRRFQGRFLEEPYLSNELLSSELQLLVKYSAINRAVLIGSSEERPLTTFTPCFELLSICGPLFGIEYDINRGLTRIPGRVQ